MVVYLQGSTERTDLSGFIAEGELSGVSLRCGTGQPPFTSDTLVEEFHLTLSNTNGVGSNVLRLEG